jgi:hypothetical protein
MKKPPRPKGKRPGHKVAPPIMRKAGSEEVHCKRRQKAEPFSRSTTRLAAAAKSSPARTSMLPIRRSSRSKTVRPVPGAVRPSVA